jgi:hypothetical protein
MLIAVLILTSSVLIAQSSILLGPRDTEAAIGADVTLSCSMATQLSSACSVEWSYKRRPWDMFQLIYTSCSMIGEFGTRHNVVENHSNGQFNLKITNVSLDDSGTYTCLDNTDGDHQRAQLIVFDSYPSTEFCSVIAPPDGPIGNNTCEIQPDEVKLSCKMSFSGNTNPIMEWIQADGDILASNIKTTTYNGVTVSTLVLSAARVQSTTYTCRIKYLQSNLTSKISWSATPHIFHIMNRNETLLMNTSTQEFDCAKGGLPGNCSFSWAHDGARLPDSGSVLTLTEESTGIYICSAVCSIRGRNCSIVGPQVMINDQRISRMNKTVIISVLIAAVVLLVSISEVLLFVIMSRRLNALRSSNVKSVAIEKTSLQTGDEEERSVCRDAIMKFNEKRMAHIDALMRPSTDVV